MRRVAIGSLLVSQTLVLAAIFGLGLRAADTVLSDSPLAPHVLVPVAGARIAHDIRNEALRLASHAGFVRNEVRRVALRTSGYPPVIAWRSRPPSGS